MPIELELRTWRLVLRRWRDGDRDLFAALNADPVPAGDPLQPHVLYRLDRAGWRRDRAAAR